MLFASVQRLAHTHQRRSWRSRAVLLVYNKILTVRLTSTFSLGFTQGQNKMSDKRVSVREAEQVPHPRSRKAGPRFGMTCGVG